MQATLSPDSHISFEAQGHGKPLVFLHAFPLDQRMWKEQIDEFSGDYYAVTMDARGAGNSSPFVGSASVEQIARDLDQLLTYLKIQQPIALCGLSMGGYAAMAFARLFPERLCALILADTRADADSEEARAGRATMIQVATEQGSAAVVEKMLPKLLCKQTPEAKPQVVEQVRTMGGQQNQHNLARLLEALRDRPDSSELLANLNVPTLIITGEEDAVSSPEIMGATAKSMPQARHVVIGGAGHLSNLEQPEKFNSAVRGFLQSF